MANSAEFVKKRAYLPEIRANSPEFSLIKIVAWYRRNLHPYEEIDLFKLKEEVNYNLFLWLGDFAKWTFHTSVSGLILWVVSLSFINPGPRWFLFFPLGLLWWTVLRFVKDLRQNLK